MYYDKYIDDKLEINTKGVLHYLVSTLTLLAVLLLKHKEKTKTALS